VPGYVSRIWHDNTPGDASSAADFNAWEARQDAAFDLFLAIVGVSVKDPQFGAVGDGIVDDSDAFQAAIDYVDQYNGGDPTLSSSYTYPRGGIVAVPWGIYRVTRSIYTEARVRIIGVQGYSAGGTTSTLWADPAGTYSNGPYTEKFLLKMGRRSTGGYWWHSGTIESFRLDCNSVTGLAGFHCWGSGENSLIDRVAVVNTGWTDRTITDLAYTAGSKIVTSAAGTFTQDDVGGRVTNNDAVGFPTSWTSTQVTGHVRVRGSAVLTDDLANFTSADLGKQLCWADSDAAGASPHYVVSVDSSKQVTMSDTFRDPTTNTLKVLGAPTGGTFTITVGGQTTTTLSPSASATTVRNALAALSTVGTGNVTVTGSLPSTMKVTFLTAAHPGNVSVAHTFTGGTTPSVTFTNGPYFLRQPQGLRIERVVNSTTAWLTRQAVTTGTAGNATVRRPRPGVQYHAGGATMRIGSLNVSGNSGPGLEIISGAGGEIQSLTGDNNGTCLLRLRDTAISGDHAPFFVGVKAENNSYGSSDLQIQGDHDPVVLVDGAGMLLLQLHGSVAAGQRGSRDVVRVDRSNLFAAGLPSFELDTSGANPYNQEFENEFRDTDSGRSVKTRMLDSSAYGGRLNPKILVNRDPITLGTVPGTFEDYFDWGDFVRNVPRTGPARAATEASIPQNWRHHVAGQDDPNLTVGTGWSLQKFVGAAGGNQDIVGNNTTSADLIEMHWHLPCSAGTWTFNVLAWKWADSPIVDWAWSQDGTTWNAITSRDLYSAATNIYDAPRVTGIVLPATASTQPLTTIRAKFNGRNASNTTGYFMRLISFGLTRTA
jgi:hypothetical protein